MTEARANAATPLRLIAVALAATAVTSLLSVSGCGGDSDTRDSDTAEPSATTDTRTPADPLALQAGAPEPGTFAESHRPERLAEIGPESCRECHAEIVDQWMGSHHANANRPIDPARDLPHFQPPATVTEGDWVTLMTVSDESAMPEVSTWADEAEHFAYQPVGVIGIDPLIQYLLETEDGRFQAMSVAFDPHQGEWFEIFPGEARSPGEWGHWTGQGMNWNANCAWCHMTEYHKNLDPETGAYASTWTQQGVACAQCHGNLAEHVARADEPGYTSVIPKLNETQVMANCASCHSRRDELTAEGFKAGEAFHQHFGLSLPDQPGLYYPDGQIRDEVYVWGSFQMSTMGHAGVSCADCHDPHSNANILPWQDNSLCLRCHSSGLDGATIVIPTEHSHHAAGSTGNLCVECHMPHTTYMQRDPRRDHGFLSPDPLMTQELGIPNACNRCHDDQSVDWAVEWAEKWYGEQLADKPQRQRARALHAAYQGQPDAAAALLELAKYEEIPAWRATYTGLLAAYAQRPEVNAYLRSRLDDISSLVRQRAMVSLSGDPAAGAALRKGLEDPSRNVRLQAARALFNRREPLNDRRVEDEWQTYLDFHADRVDSALMAAAAALRNGDTQRALSRIRRGVAAERTNPEVLRQAAILYSSANRNADAERMLMRALELAPESPEINYSIALLKAEQNQLSSTIRYLRRTVDLSPDYYRAWYNLALAYTKTDQWEQAAEALQRAAPGMAAERGFQQTYQIVQQRLRQQQQPQ